MDLEFGWRSASSLPLARNNRSGGQRLCWFCLVEGEKDAETICGRLTFSRLPPVLAVPASGARNSTKRYATRMCFLFQTTTSPVEMDLTAIGAALTGIAKHDGYSTSRRFGSACPPKGDVKQLD